MTCENDFVEMVCASGRLNLCCICVSYHGRHRGVELYAVFKWFYEYIAVSAASSIECVPLMLRIQSQESVVFEKTNERDDRKIHYFFHRRRPYCGAHRYQVL